MEINIERSPQHWCPSDGSNSELFAHENDTLTARPQLHKYDITRCKTFFFCVYVHQEHHFINLSKSE